MKRPLHFLLFSCLCLFTLWDLTKISYASAELPTIKEIAELEQNAETLLERKNVDVNSYKAGKTPLSTLLAIKEAASNKRWDDAGKYLDMRYLPQELRDEGAGELIRKLSIIWNQQNIVDPSTISDVAEGQQNDSLPSYRDLLGILQSSSGPTPIYLQRVPDGDGGKVWKISNSTVTQIPKLWNEFGYNEHIEELALYLPEFKVINMTNWQFSAFIILILLSWFITGIFKGITTFIFGKHKENGPMLIRFFGISVRMFLFFSLINYGTSFLGLSLRAKVWLTSGTLIYLASIFLVLGIIQLSTSIYLKRKKTSSYSAAILRPLMTTVKIFVVLLIILNWFESAGYNIATILTGLGIGSLAIALAAQKTLENVFGAFTLYVAKPIKPGDFCQFGDIIGTVEEIGLRSTRIRKLNRSVVHVPNSVFASKELENFAEIDRRLYRKEFRFRLDTSSDQLRQLLIKLRDLLLCHERVLPTAARVRFEDIERDAFVVVVNCYVNTKSVVDFKAVAEDLNLYILDIIRDLGIEWAIPQQQILIGRASSTNDELVKSAHESMDVLRSEHQLPFPDFSPEDVKLRKDTLSYPPKGSINDKAPIIDNIMVDGYDEIEHNSDTSADGRV